MEAGVDLPNQSCLALSSIAALLSVLLLAASGVIAAPAPAPIPAPAEQAAQADAIDTNRRFTCPAKVQSYCGASNIHSGCTSNGEFKSDAMDTCRDCTLAARMPEKAVLWMCAAVLFSSHTRARRCYDSPW
ncbi:basic-Leucine zipper transcription factor [Purpureocillium lavendulum]|uniref:Basic-Leucine zipper transcription factor n=1 Tax=Purpureocillium lavendulum TaxID=1247861 RepID=A0AB34G0I5_9HYPO|nr:basic-Leucine zipper transcription factor [Purpureocillium lavendulum]